MAAGLAAMVAGMSRGKKAYVQYESQLSEAIARLSTLREELKAAVDKDADAYRGLVAAFKAAKDNPNGGGAVNAATREAINVPLSVAQKSAEVQRIAESLRAVTNPKMASDLTVAIALSRAAIEGAVANVEINLEGFDDVAFAEEVKGQVAAIRR